MDGWIKLHRKFTDWEWYHQSEMVHLFIHLLITANKEEKEWNGIKVMRGQLITGRNSLSKGTGMSERKIRTCLGRLKNDQQIAIKTTNKFSIITICKYKSYQSMKIKNDQQNDQQTATTKEERKEYTLTHKMRLKFQECYLKEKGIDYYYEAKDAKQLSNLINKFKKRAKDKNTEPTDDLCLNYLESLLKHITAHKDNSEKWIYENLSIPNLNSQYQQIIARGKKIKTNGHQESIREVKPF